MWYSDYQNKNLNFCTLNSFKGFHLCIKLVIMQYLDNQVRKKLNLSMLLQANKNILSTNQIRIQNIDTCLKNVIFIQTILSFVLSRKIINVNDFYKIEYKLQSNMCITTTWWTKFLWSLQTGGRYKEDLCITAKTVDSDIWLLYKGSIIFHLITHDTGRFS